ncbi:hypothetical protein MFLO_02648 [Listeria floridensis FSL S10-1187]|uniref:Uncharacterized protein n=1 Tax=Listeria floridensis FSL S10-1187 TaxID=1265817 RepID=A0ABP3B1K6_9LIST|nr:hypothetical protein [Listeria floridensis]EUJ33416.1 hypothetical protein MFLO_02648 [Listeria floridensis FSL S10-1187]
MIKTDSLASIRILDSSDTTVMNTKSLQKDTNTISLKLTKSTLNSLQNNLLTITGNFDLNMDAPTLIDTFQSDGFFHIPIEASNDNQPSEKVIGEALVKMPAPTGTPIKQTVSLHSGTDELDPVDLVTDLKSVLPQDTIKILSIKEPRTFEKLGNTSIDVLIESELTHVQGIVSVPIQVETGSLKLVSVPQSIDFGTLPISSSVLDAPVKQTVNDLAVQETRFFGKWELGASISKPLVGQVHRRPLGKLFYFINGQRLPLSNSLQIVESGKYTGRKQPLAFSKMWNAKNGLILEIQQGEALRENYQGEVTWNLRNVPV